MEAAGGDPDAFMLAELRRAVGHEVEETLTASGRSRAQSGLILNLMRYAERRSNHTSPTELTITRAAFLVALREPIDHDNTTSTDRPRSSRAQSVV